MWKKNALKRLKEKGYKLTPQRLKLVEILDRIGSEHPSLKEVLDEIREEFPTVSFSTLYSNVLTLKELGLLELFSLDGETRVELNTEPHINLISGGKVIDFNDPEIIERIREKTGRKVKLVNVILD
ncbi:Fur family transcriptional regulator [Thermococcus barophilus]|uniref:Ferric uptake regulation protein n=2 Tax=Thermococcus barophilus TaxID=55802 RepID=A0A0S1X9J4_THEBA|nr:Fur family transcriptional regulator [Thermococcus barophilus]ADT83338.1 iron(II) uptake regulation protein [Thermococcus barophilus MP]ALM74388.1 Ferric uptake regulation protein [Thermococcus barophilus]